MYRTGWGGETLGRQEVDPGMGNAPSQSLDGSYSLEHSNLWDGANPPAGSDRTVCGNDMFTGIPSPC